MNSGRHKDIDQRFLLLLEKKMTGKANLIELAELDSMANADPEIQYVVETVYQLWKKQLPRLTNAVIQKVANEEVPIQQHRKRYALLPANQHRYRASIPPKKLTWFKNNVMIKSYLKIAIRNLQKQRVIALINVLGLSVGIACFILLLLFSANEFSFDKFHKNAADIYRAYVWNDSWNGQPEIGYTDFSGPNPISMGEAMKKNLPGITDYVRIQLPWGENLIRTDKTTTRVSLSFADPSFFSVFTFPLKYGSVSSALHNLNDIVLTESRAKQLFGNDDAIGKIIQIQVGTAFLPFTVRAVAQDMPSNSTVRFDVLGNYQFAVSNNDKFTIGNNWHPTVRETFVQLNHGDN